MRVGNVVPRAIGVTVFVGMILTGVAFAAGVSEPPLTAQKEAIVQREQARQATLLAGPHGLKPTHPHFLPVTRHYTVGIWPFRFGPFHGGRNMINVGSVVSSQGVHYDVYAGATDQDVQQGVLVVFRDADPPFYVGGASVDSYLDPVREGPLTITEIAGESIVLNAASGRTVRFNVVTGLFSS